LGRVTIGSIVCPRPYRLFRVSDSRLDNSLSQFHIITRIPARGSIEWASNAERTTVEDVRVDHRRSHVAVPKQLLDRANIVACLEEVSGKTVAERVAGGGLGQAQRADCVTKSSLKDGFMQVVASALTGIGMKIEPSTQGEPPRALPSSSILLPLCANRPPNVPAFSCVRQSDGEAGATSSSAAAPCWASSVPESNS
jgi:hypothetical protein